MQRSFPLKLNMSRYSICDTCKSSALVFSPSIPYGRSPLWCLKILWRFDVRHMTLRQGHDPDPLVGSDANWIEAKITQVSMWLYIMQISASTGSSQAHERTTARAISQTEQSAVGMTFHHKITIIHSRTSAKLFGTHHNMHYVVLKTKLLVWFVLNQI